MYESFYFFSFSRPKEKVIAVSLKIQLSLYRLSNGFEIFPKINYKPYEYRVKNFADEGKMNNFADSKGQSKNEEKGVQENRVAFAPVVFIILVRYYTVYPLARGERGSHCALTSFPYRTCSYGCPV